MSEAYRQSGVDIDAGNEAVERIKEHVARTRRPEVMGRIGGFGGLFSLSGYQDPVLVAATDGVGTKLKLAFALERHDTIGIDCVAMCVNDLVVQGAEPLFFLDYIATGKLSPHQVETVVKGIADGCEEAGCALLGGETAEMPGFYAPGEYDVAGFCVGAVEKQSLLTGETIAPGDILIGLASRGLHANGFSLVRKIVADTNLSLEATVPWNTHIWGEELLRPTRIYVRSFQQLMKAATIKGAAHITGGGLIENVPRMLPPGLQAQIEPGSWRIPEVFSFLAERSSLSVADCYRTFNMGVGMVVCVAQEDAERVLQVATQSGEDAAIIGRVTLGENGVVGLGGDAN
jgi:phosphoribosylformylglycinamidine cyclo-ligase